MKVHQKRLLAEHSATPWVTVLLPVAAQLPVFVLSTVVVARACAPGSPRDAEAFLSLTSLTHVDPTAALPIALGLVTLANVESSSWFASAAQAERARNTAEWAAARRARGENVLETGKYIKSGLRLLSVGRILWAATVPGVSRASPGVICC
jgi:inner membrane protein COX18